MNNRLESVKRALADAQYALAQLETSYRAFLADTFSRTYAGMSGHVLRKDHENQRHGYRVAWRKTEDEIRELSWLISDIESQTQPNLEG